MNIQHVSVLVACPQELTLGKNISITKLGHQLPLAVFFTNHIVEWHVYANYSVLTEKLNDGF